MLAKSILNQPVLRLVLGAFLVASQVAFISLQAQPLPDTRPERQGMSTERLQHMHNLIHRQIDDGKYAGAIWLIARHGRVVDWDSYGYRDLESKAPMEKNTICRIYSMSKMVTSVAVLQLIEEGRLGLDDPVSRYLPSLKGMKVMVGGTADAPQLVASTNEITVLHLLTHTSGLAYGFTGTEGIAALYNKADLWSSKTLTEFVLKVAKLPLQHQPGAAFLYGVNSDVLGALVEVVSGQSFEDFLKKRIFDPLEMEDTGFYVPKDKQARVATIYQRGADGRLAKAVPILGVNLIPGQGFPSGGGGLFSTASDFTRFAQMLLNGGKLGRAQILGRKSVELMRQNFLAHIGSGTHQFSNGHGFGLGVEVRTDLTRGGTLGSLGQFGWYGAATTYCNIDPQEKTVAILFIQHFPFNENGLFNLFSNSWYQAILD